MGNTFFATNKKEQSMLIKNEKVESIHEYAEAKLILSLYPTDLLLISNWVATSVVYKVAPGNLLKHWIRPIPGFDEEHYPFLVCSGRESLNLINVKNADSEKLIITSCINIRCQPAFFFKEEDYGFSMHFATKDMSDENIEIHKWHMLPFKDDFRETVMTTGNLPVSSLAKKLRMASKL